MKFETHGEAMAYCHRFGVKTSPMDAFDNAIALSKAYEAGRDELTAENATLRAQLAEAMQLLRDCTNAYVEPADRLRALDRAESWVADYDNPDA